MQVASGSVLVQRSVPHEAPQVVPSKRVYMTAGLVVTPQRVIFAMSAGSSMGSARTAALSAGAASPKGMDTAKSGSIDLNMNMTTKMMFF